MMWRSKDNADNREVNLKPATLYALLTKAYQRGGILERIHAHGLVGEWCHIYQDYDAIERVSHFGRPSPKNEGRGKAYCSQSEAESGQDGLNYVTPSSSGQLTVPSEAASIAL